MNEHERKLLEEEARLRLDRQFAAICKQLAPPMSKLISRYLDDCIRRVQQTNPTPEAETK